MITKAWANFYVIYVIFFAVCVYNNKLSILDLYLTSSRNIAFFDIFYGTAQSPARLSVRAVFHQSRYQIYSLC